MATKKIEDGIRAYLSSLGQTGKPVVDREAIKAFKAQIKAESDPIELLRLHAALSEAEEGSMPDNSGDKAVFVAEAKGFAEAESIPVSAFQALGVPDDVLKEAGFTVTASTKRATRSGGGGTRAPRLDLETDVKPAVKKLGSGWKLSDLAEALGRDTATTRNYVNKLVESGDVAIVGDDPNHDGRGRAPKVYAVA